MKKYDLILDCLQQKCKELYFRNGMNLKGFKNPLEIDTSAQLLSEYKDFGIIKYFLEINFKIENFKDKINKEFVKNKDALTLLRILLKNSKNSYIVGGCVRDILLDETPKDFDFVTDISYDKLKEIFSSKEFSFKETGTNFLVFNLNYKGVDYEIANFRYESDYEDGRRPTEVRVGTIEEDRQRRDFHINSIFWNPYELYTHRFAIEDIEKRILRFVGNPEERLKEDYLRGIRFYRLLKTKNLIPDKTSLSAVRRNFDNIMKVTPHRMMMEIERMVGL